MEEPDGSLTMSCMLSVFMFTLYTRSGETAGVKENEVTGLKTVGVRGIENGVIQRAGCKSRVLCFRELKGSTGLLIGLSVLSEALVLEANP